KTTIRANAGHAANDEGNRSAGPAVVQLRALRVAESFPDEHARTLLARIAAGDEAAFEELYRMLSRRVYAFALRVTANAASAEEVMIDTMHEVWRSAGRFRCDAKVSTWVLSIARNKALMVRRSRPAAEHADIAELADSLDSGMPDGFALLVQ